MKKFLFVLACLAFAVGPPVYAQPDHRGEDVTQSTDYRGVKADAPIPPEMHIKNEGGSDNQGLCVISSILVSGQFQRVPGLYQKGKGSLLWQTAKKEPGGYYPEKLARLIARVMPAEKYASFVGDGGPGDQEKLERLSRAGYPVGVTMNTGQLYKYQPISHMVTLIYYRRNGWACIIDNNRPNFYSWMPAEEFNRRWADHGTAWGWVWTRPPLAPLLGGSTLILVAAAILIIVEVNGRETQETAS